MGQWHDRVGWAGPPGRALRAGPHHAAVATRRSTRSTSLCAVSTMHRSWSSKTRSRSAIDWPATRRGGARSGLYPARAGPLLGHHQAGLQGRSCYYDAYVMIDIYSQHIVGAHVHAHKSATLAEKMKGLRHPRDPRVVHADCGTSMTSKSVATLLPDLGRWRALPLLAVLNCESRTHSGSRSSALSLPAARFLGLDVKKQLTHVRTVARHLPYPRPFPGPTPITSPVSKPGCGMSTCSAQGGSFHGDGY